MSVLSTVRPSPTPADEQKFNQLVATWKANRGAASSLTALSMQPAYQQIIGMGPAAVPLLLRELERAPDHWFWALKAITGADPIASEQRGRVADMAAAWLRWGREQGYAW